MENHPFKYLKKFLEEFLHINSEEISKKNPESHFGLCELKKSVEEFHKESMEDFPKKSFGISFQFLQELSG